MQDPTIKRRRLTAVIILIFLFLLGGAWYAHNHSNSKSTSQQTQNTSYTGTDALLNVGATSFVINDMQFSFHEFLQKNNQPLSQTIALTNVSHRHNTTTGYDTYTFTVTMKSGTYQGSLNTSSLDAAQLLLTNSQGVQVFDSGVVTLSPAPSTGN